LQNAYLLLYTINYKHNVGYQKIDLSLSFFSWTTFQWTNEHSPSLQRHGSLLGQE